MPEVSQQAWEKFYQSNPQAHIYQSPYWGELKSESVWKPVRLINGENGVQILIRKLPLGYTMAYISKGPVGNDWHSLWPDVDECCRAHRSFFLLVEPDFWEEESIDMSSQGFTRSEIHFENRRTILLDISKSEEDILAAMKKKTRYNIGLAYKKGVIVKPSSDMETFTQIMRATCERNEMENHPLRYYRRAYEQFHQAGEGEFMIAEYEGTPIACLFTCYHGKCAWSVYGGSCNQYRNLMSFHLLQWESIRWAKKQGCTEYNFSGVPDYDEEELESQFLNRNDGLWGVYRFKRGFGGQVKRSCQGWERVYDYVPYMIFKQMFTIKTVKHLFYQIRKIFQG